MCFYVLFAMIILTNVYAGMMRHRVAQRMCKKLDAFSAHAEAKLAEFDQAVERLTLLLS